MKDKTMRLSIFLWVCAILAGVLFLNLKTDTDQFDAASQLMRKLQSSALIQPTNEELKILATANTQSKERVETLQNLINAVVGKAREIITDIAAQTIIIDDFSLRAPRSFFIKNIDSKLWNFWSNSQLRELLDGINTQVNDKNLRESFISWYQTLCITDDPNSDPAKRGTVSFPGGANPIPDMCTSASTLVQTECINRQVGQTITTNCPNCNDGVCGWWAEVAPVFKGFAIGIMETVVVGTKSNITIKAILGDGTIDIGHNRWVVILVDGDPEAEFPLTIQTLVNGYLEISQGIVFKKTGQMKVIVKDVETGNQSSTSVTVVAPDIVPVAKTCPQITIPADYCANGVITPGWLDSNGCTLAPTCTITKTAVTETNKTTQQYDDNYAPACDNGQQNGCQNGISSDLSVADTADTFKWQCLSNDGKKKSPVCYMTKPGGPVCNNLERNGCLSGVWNDSALGDTSTHYRWICYSPDQTRRSANCSIEKPLPGSCNNTAHNGCLVGTANDLLADDDDVYYKWVCEGVNGGSNSAVCSKNKPANGLCDESKTYGCAVGVLQKTTDAGGYARWVCTGQFGGSNSPMCRYSLYSDSMQGVCNNNAVNSCQHGVPDDNSVPDTQDEYRWTCKGINGWATSVNCFIPKPIAGKCDSSKPYTCSIGYVIPQANGKDGLLRWSCGGFNGGQNSTICSIDTVVNPVIDGQCLSTYRLGCLSGKPNDAAIADTATHYTWRCDGINGGIDSITCLDEKPSNGACNESKAYACQSGDLVEINDTDTHKRWYCNGRHGGTNSNLCLFNK